jgi:hypothetical protein
MRRAKLPVYLGQHGATSFNHGLPGDFVAGHVEGHLLGNVLKQPGL